MQDLLRMDGSGNMEGWGEEEDEAPPAYTSPVKSNNSQALKSVKEGSEDDGEAGEGEGEVEEEEEEEEGCVMRAFKLLRSLGGLILLLLLYTFLGAWIMMAIEGPHEDAQKQEVYNVKENITNRLKNNTVALQAGRMNETEWEASMKDMLVLLEDTVHSSGVSTASKKKWTFFGGVLFCVTTYTTIGYGNIAPITKAGRVATMLYAVIGVPLALIVLADLGHRLAQALKFLWSFVRRYYYTGYCRKPSAAANKRSYDMNESQAGLGVGVGGGAGGGVGVDGVFRSGSKQWEGSGTVYRQESEGRQRQRTSVTPVRGDREGTPLAQQAALGRGEAGKDAVDGLGRWQSVERGSVTGSSTPRVDTASLQDCRVNVCRPRAPVKKDTVFLERTELTEEFSLPVLVAIGFIFAYIFLGAGMYKLWEEWSYLESFYFVFITTSTIGFGDVLPEHPNFFLLSCIYTFLGLALVSMTINVIMEWLTETIDRAKEKVDQAKEKAMAKAKAAKGKLTEVGSRAKNKVLYKSISKDGSDSPQLPDKESTKESELHVLADREESCERELPAHKASLNSVAHEAKDDKGVSPAQPADQQSTPVSGTGERGDQHPPSQTTTGDGGAGEVDTQRKEWTDLPTPSSDNEVSFRSANDFASSDSFCEPTEQMDH